MKDLKTAWEALGDDPEDYQIWLTGSVDQAAALLKPYPAQKMRIVRQGVGETADGNGP